jgi:hypothetical protein
MLDIELPIVAIFISGEDAVIKLTIDEVFGFPDRTSHVGGYDAKGTLSIRAGKYSVKDAVHYFSTGELYEFGIQLQQCYDHISGEACLKTFEKNLSLSVKFEKRGSVILSGHFQERSDQNNILHFDLRVDQTYIKPTLDSLKRIRRLFGGMQGINKP